jgi:hypothetical protein
MNVREIFEGNDPILRRDYSYTIGRFAKDRTFKKDATPEDRAIKTITDIYYYSPDKISSKQVDWMIRYATKFRITGDAKKEMLLKINSAITSIN